MAINECRNTSEHFLTKTCVLQQVCVKFYVHILARNMYAIKFTIKYISCRQNDVTTVNQARDKQPYALAFPPRWGMLLVLYRFYRTGTPRMRLTAGLSRHVTTSAIFLCYLSINERYRVETK
jgi:hypothetical protein